MAGDLLLSALFACKDEASSKFNPATPLISEMRQFRGGDDSCALDSTAIAKKYIPIGISKKEALKLLEKNEFYFVGIPQPPDVKAFVIDSEDWAHTYIHYEVSINIKGNKVNQVSSKIYCMLD